MTVPPLQVALHYLQRHCSGRDIDALRPLLADAFVFEGPRRRFTSADEYVAGLRADPPDEATCEVLASVVDGNHVALLYTHRTPGVETVMAQFLVIEEGRIARARLVCDTAAFGTGGPDAEG
jgi:ketosteroid isomerase-like protein